MGINNSSLYYQALKNNLKVIGNFNDCLRKNIKDTDNEIKIKLKQKNFKNIFKLYIKKQNFINQLNRRLYDNSYNRLDRKR